MHTDLLPIIDVYLPNNKVIALDVETNDKIMKVRCNTYNDLCTKFNLKPKENINYKEEILKIYDYVHYLKQNELYNYFPVDQYFEKRIIVLKQLDQIEKDIGIQVLYMQRMLRNINIDLLKLPKIDDKSYNKKVIFLFHIILNHDGSSSLAVLSTWVSFEYIVRKTQLNIDDVDLEYIFGMECDEYCFEKYILVNKYPSLINKDRIYLAYAFFHVDESCDLIEKCNLTDDEIKTIIYNSLNAWWKSNSFAKLYPDIYITTILKQNLSSSYPNFDLNELKKLVPESLINDKRILNDINLKKLFV